MKFDLSASSVSLHNGKRWEKEIRFVRGNVKKGWLRGHAETSKTGGKYGDE